jgi:hypothetical protein
MASLTITNADVGNVILSDAKFDSNQVLTLAAADTIASGTILARDSSSLKYVLYVIGGSTNENGIPKAVLTYELVSAASGDFAIRPMIKGKVRQEKLIVDADGDATNITNAIRDQLRDYGIIPQSVDEINIVDNQ